MRTFPTDGRWVYRLDYSPDSRTLIVDSRAPADYGNGPTFDSQSATDLVCWDWLAGTVRWRDRLRDCLDGESQAELQATFGGNFYPREVSFRVEPYRVATAWDWSGEEDNLSVYDPNLHELISQRVSYRTRYFRFILAPDGRSIAARAMYARAEMGCVEVWRFDGTSEVTRVFDWVGDTAGWFEDDVLADPNGQPRPEAALAFDGRWVASVGVHPTALRLWDSRATAPTDETWDLQEVAPEACIDRDLGFVPFQLAFAARSPVLAVGGTGLGVYDVARQHWLDLQQSRGFHAVAVSDDGAVLLAGTEDGSVELWDTASGRLMQQLDLEHGPITAVALAPDGLTGAAGTRTGHVVVWDREG